MATRPFTYMRPDPEEYWARSPQSAQIDEMRDKYLALERLAALEDEVARRRALRAAARRWPAALREAELVHPDVIRRRMNWANGLPAQLPRSQWRDMGAQAVVLWADLHELLHDQLAARRRLRAARASDDTGTSDADDVPRGPALTSEPFVDALVDAARARWPDATRLTALCGEVVRPRQAYLWLAAQAGMTLPELNYALFDRAGHWDRRDGDPDWAG